MNKEKIIKIVIVLCFVITGLCFLLGGSKENEAESYSLVTSEAVTEAAPGEVQTIEAASEPSSSETKIDDGLVNINTADEAELTTLKGIGTVRARAIIEYRKKNGPFAKKTDIMKVSGIKEASYEKIKDSIKVE